MDGKQTNIRGYYALPAMLERNIVIDFLFWADARAVETTDLQNLYYTSWVRIPLCPQKKIHYKVVVTNLKRYSTAEVTKMVNVSD